MCTACVIRSRLCLGAYYSALLTVLPTAPLYRPAPKCMLSRSIPDLRDAWAHEDNGMILQVSYNAYQHNINKPAPSVSQRLIMLIRCSMQHASDYTVSRSAGAQLRTPLRGHILSVVKTLTLRHLLPCWRMMVLWAGFAEV